MFGGRTLIKPLAMVLINVKHNERLQKLKQPLSCDKRVEWRPHLPTQTVSRLLAVH